MSSERIRGRLALLPLGVVLGVIFGVAGMARGEELNAKLPQDSLAFVELDPGAGGAKGAGGGNALLDVGLEAMQSFGVLPKEAAAVGDVVGLIALAGNHHSCAALMDADLGAVDERPLISNRAGGKNLQCKSVQLVWIIDDGGGAAEARAMVDRLTHLLDHVSTPKNARQTVRKAAESKREYVEFYDIAWPAWMKLAWMQDGNDFVVTFGAEAMEHYLAGRPVGGAPWVDQLAAVDAAAKEQEQGGKVMARLYVNAKAFRDRFPEAMGKTVLGRMFAGLGFGGAPVPVDVGLLSARGKGRAISLDGATIGAGKIAVTPWTVDLPADSPLLKLVPPEATAYLALRVDWRVAYSRALAVLDSMMTGAGDEPVEKKVAEFAAQNGVDVRKDILSKLEPIVVVHDAPQHPLRLPLMVTAVGAAQPADAEDVERSMKALLDAAAAAMDKKAAARGESDLLRLRLRTDKDGVRYLQFALVGPAWTWVGNRIVFSWSPTAVRYNVAAAGRVDATAFSGVAAVHVP